MGIDFWKIFWYNTDTVKERGIKMTIKTVKTISLDDAELMKLRCARDVLVKLEDKLSDDNIDELICGLESIIYSDGWEIELEE